MKSVAIVGTGLIGASIGLALRARGFRGEIAGWDANPAELAAAVALGAIDRALPSREAVLGTDADVVVLATPVLPILDWMERLAPVLKPSQLVTDVGSTKREIAELAAKLFGGSGEGGPRKGPAADGAARAQFLPGHPMAGKESGGAALAEAGLFQNAVWLFTPLTRGVAGESGGEPSPLAQSEPSPLAQSEPSPLAQSWREAVTGFGARVEEIDPVRHDEVCAWVSHLPQMLSTALAALLEETFAGDARGMAAVQAIGGRALRETTRLGASPYSMWRDVALTNTEAITRTLEALEQRLAYVRENLRTPELREEFARANRFRAKHG